MRIWMTVLCLSFVSLILPPGAGAETETISITGKRVIAQADVSVTATATLVAAMNTSRSAFSCTNNDSAVPVRWGDATVTATKGQRLPAGTAIEILNRGAIYMISEDTDATVSCTEESQ